MTSLEKLKEKLRIKPSVDELEFKKVNVVIPIPTKQETVNLNKITIRDKTAESNFDINALNKALKDKKMLVTTTAPTIRKTLELEGNVVAEEAPLEIPKPKKNKKDKENEQELEAEQEEAEQEEAEAEQNEEQPKVDRKTKKVQKGISTLHPESWVNIGDKDVIKRLPEKKQKVLVKVSSYYMNNREKFVTFINQMFQPYREEFLSDSSDISCDTIGKVGSGDVELLSHQKLVRDYLNLYTPYRGLLLYHSLGSGKSLSSIAIAEGMKDAKKVVVLTPASLESNYRIELKKFDPFYKANQCWEWINVKKNPEALDTLSSILSLPTEYILSKGGAWLVNVTKPANCPNNKNPTQFEKIKKEQNKLKKDQEKGKGTPKLTNEEYENEMTKLKEREDVLNQQEMVSLNDQIDKMIETKYEFIHYNGLRRDKLKKMTDNFTVNIFDNKVIIIDEAHNFISRIVNKINKEKEIEFDAQGKKGRVYMSQAMILYEMLLTAQNCRIVLLTGTPIINYPNEIGILFNILRGYIKTWQIPLDIKSSQKITKESLLEIFQREKVLDYLDYSTANKQLIVTRNPFGFENKIKADTGYHGVTNEEKTSSGKRDIANISDIDFEKRIISILNNSGIEVVKNAIRVDMYKALPDKLDTFSNWFIEEGTINVKNTEIFKRRIMGLTSYFRSAQESLLPKYEKAVDFHVLKIDMSDEQFTIYESARAKERKQETSNKKKKGKGKVDQNGIFVEPSSTYRIFSRLYCNFVMPKAIGRPIPEPEDKEEKNRKKEENRIKRELTKIEKEQKKGGAKNAVKGKKKGFLTAIEEDAEEAEEKELEADEEAEEKEDLEEALEEEEDDDFTAVYTEALKRVKKPNKQDENDDEELEGDEVLNKLGNMDYDRRLKKSMDDLKANASKYLTPDALEIYSPKFLAMLENIQDPDHEGLNLIYSQFRSLEGVGIFKLVLEQNGFAEFKVKKDSNGVWEIDIPEDDLGKPTFALYTGTESSEEKEIIRQIYNSSWDQLSPSLTESLKRISPNNNMGEVIKVLMITASGSEGINLRNTRYVHIMEPYWHPARVEQVVGRARRICSHKDLPEKLQTVEVFLYLMTFSKSQIKSDESKELKLKDLSKKEYEVETKFDKMGNPTKTELQNIPFTSDEALYEISTIKEEFSNQLITAIKESSIDCAIYSKRGNKEQLHCLQFGDPNSSVFSYTPSIDTDKTDAVRQINKLPPLEWRGREATIHGKTYIYRKINENLDNLYDVESYHRALEVPGVLPTLIATMERGRNGKKVLKEI